MSRLPRLFPCLSADARPSLPPYKPIKHSPLTIVAVDRVVVALVADVCGRRRRARGLEPARVLVGEAGRLLCVYVGGGGEMHS